MRQHRIYSKLGGDLVYGCERLAKGLGAAGVVIILDRGQGEETEIGMTFAPGFEIEASSFRQLANAILDGTYSESLKMADKACLMLAEATEAECVTQFIIHNDGSVQITVSAPQTHEFVAARALKIGNDLDAMN